jgi:hypothetical protein
MTIRPNRLQHPPQDFYFLGSSKVANPKINELLGEKSLKGDRKAKEAQKRSAAKAYHTA